MEVDALFVTALLTVAGFCVHDAIIIFDRIRENMRTAGKRDTFDDGRTAASSTPASSCRSGACWA